MHRFFVNEKNILGEEQKIIIDDKEDVKHIGKVLRLSQEDRIEICDGQNIDYIGEIISLTKSEIIVNILERRLSKTEPLVNITLFQGIPKSAKMDMIIQKCTELGIKRIVPVVTERTIVQLKDEKAETKKIERWQKVADAAAKQCKRGRIPTIAYPISFEEMLNEIATYDLRMIPYEQEENRGIKGLLKNNGDYKSVAIIIGPEGGFEKDEIIAAQGKGALSVTLGPRILRTETAGFVALSILMYEMGDLGGI
ncbi:16S rRNA (uracil(1498)-N(3))-methyltransferase [Marinisporobacter balticus]|uniref:Ribosomal RNA small subunit methyltransferase E n=1 Tax=Marinisporobacter balticus TaxID=2018667 RepID=A0A4R2KZD4_9FIRM|nr:16S rRNA (uracil(1498)-N(3))-methyltransferase [Marinisporobacter balticus]TCO80051.1 16S rRNA (uracil1498-N3)-methyltransferase [Marinisporobacter balticus]